MDFNKITEKLDLSKTERTYVDVFQMCQSEFDILEYLEQPKENVRLTYCYTHRWVCTDTEVGIRVWFLDDIAVCLSFQPYRKSDEQFHWRSEKHFVRVKNYLSSLRVEVFDVSILDEDTYEEIKAKAKSIDYKAHEFINLI